MMQKYPNQVWGIETFSWYKERELLQVVTVSAVKRFMAGL